MTRASAVRAVAPDATRTLRLFVALELPAEVRAALAEWTLAVAPPEVRLVPAANLHLTLAFLGARAAADVEAIAAVLGGVPTVSVRCASAGALWLPARKPGVLTVALERDQALTALRRDLVACLTSALGWEPERRAFRPHITVARVRRGARVDAGELAPPAPRLTFLSTALTLFESRLGAGGPRYEPLARFESGDLGQSPDGGR